MCIRDSDGRWIDSAKPIVFAITSKRATPPGVTALVPTTDSSAYCKSLGSTSKAFGDYVVVSLAGKYEPSSKPCTLLDNLAPGCISLSGDVATFAKNYKVLINSALDLAAKQMLAEMPESDDGIDMEEVLDLYLELARTVLTSTESLGAGIDYRAGKLDVIVQMQALPGGAMAGWSSPAIDPKPLAAGMTGKGSLEMLFLGDINSLGPHYDAMMSRLLEIYPADMQEAVGEMMAGYKEAYGLMGPGMAMEGDIFSADGMRITARMMPKDPDALMTKFVDVLGHKSADTLGISAQDVQRTQGEESNTLDFGMAFDTKKMASWMGNFDSGSEVGNSVFQHLLPQEPVPVRATWSSDQLAISVGKSAKTNAANALAANSGSWSPQLQEALQQLDGCNPAVAYRIDYATMVRAGFEAMKGAMPDQRLPELPEGKAVNLTLFGGVQGNAWRFGTTLDLRGMIELFAALVPR